MNRPKSEAQNFETQDYYCDPYYHEYSYEDSYFTENETYPN